MLIDAIRAGHGTRAEEIAREHARLAQLNLDLVLSDQAALAEIREAPLLRRVPNDEGWRTEAAGG